MPTPNKNKKKGPGAKRRSYITKGGFDGGENFRDIAKELTLRGHKINHATARNLMVSGIKKVLCSVSVSMTGKTIPDSKLEEMLKEKETYQVFSDMLHQLYGSEEGRQQQSQGESVSHD